MSLPNRSERRRVAKSLGLFKKGKRKNAEQSEKAQALGKLIHLRNLTEQRNNNKKSE